jgi:Ti-type conjugative transfer relaxase TraA
LTDKEHSHVHVVVNTVHPITGRTADQKFSKLALSRWAEGYERQHGIECEQRVTNNADRDTMRQVRQHEQQHRVDPADFVAIKDKSPTRKRWFAEGRETADQVAHILGSLTQQHSTFSRQDLARQVSLATDSASAFQTLMACVESSPELARLPGSDRLSTRSMVQAEAVLAATVDAMSQDHSHPLNRKGLRLRAQGFDLSPAQQAALTHVTNGEALSCVTGYAGAGKSHMLGAARQVWEASGYTVRGAALSGIAAEGLQSGSGITSSTLHALQWGMSNGTTTFTKQDVLVIDEAGMVGSRQMQQVISAARLGGAKVVLVGDPEQLQSIEAGAAYRAVADRTGAASIDDVRRQRVDWQRSATRSLATGRTAEALNAYVQAGQVHSHESVDAATAALIAAWSKNLGASRDAPDLILAPTRGDVAALNAEARDAMRKAGRLGQTKRLDATEERIGRPSRNFKLDLAIGDRVLFTKNDRRLGVRNGTVGTLEAFGRSSLVIRLDNKERVTVDLDRYRNLAHGYALTVHKAQGMTVDRAHVLAGRSMDRHMAYVALSRHRDSVSLHYGRDQFATPEKLTRTLSRQRLKDTTLDYGAPERVPMPKRPMVTPTWSPLSAEKRSDRVRREAIEWRLRNPEKDFGLEL